MSYIGSNAMKPLLEAVKEVNTPSADIGDLISYTITLTNLTTETLTHIVVNDIIDKSLEVEENSIGINGVVSSRQTLNNLEIPDLLPQAQSTVVFNAYIRRMPSGANATLREAAQIYFGYQGNSYQARTSEAITVVQQSPEPISYLNARMTASTEQATIGQRIKYCIVLQPNGCYGLSNIFLALALDSHLEIVVGSLYVNGAPNVCESSIIYLPDLMEGSKEESIIVEFEARVISLPTTIRALTSVIGNIIYTVNHCNIALSTATNEVLVEILPAMLACSYETIVPLMHAVPNISFIEGISIKNAAMISSYCQQGILKFDLAYQIVISYVDTGEQNQQYIVQQIYPLEYPYTEKTQINAWVNSEEVRFQSMDMIVKVHVLLNG